MSRQSNRSAALHGIRCSRSALTPHQTGAPTRNRHQDETSRRKRWANLCATLLTNDPYRRIVHPAVATGPSGRSSPVSEGHQVFSRGLRQRLRAVSSPGSGAGHRRAIAGHGARRHQRARSARRWRPPDHGRRCRRLAGQEAVAEISIRRLADVPHITPEELFATLRSDRPPLLLDWRGTTMIAETGPLAVPGTSSGETINP